MRRAVWQTTLTIRPTGSRLVPSIFSSSRTVIFAILAQRSRSRPQCRYYQTAVRLRKSMAATSATHDGVSIIVPQEHIQLFNDIESQFPSHLGAEKWQIIAVGISPLCDQRSLPCSRTLRSRLSVLRGTTMSPQIYTHTWLVYPHMQRRNSDKHSFGGCVRRWSSSSRSWACQSHWRRFFRLRSVSDRRIEISASRGEWSQFPLEHPNHSAESTA